MSDPNQGEHDDPNRSRSVNDFDTKDGLRMALQRSAALTSFADVSRDFPRALLGSTLGVPRDDDSMSECSTVFEPDGDLDWMLTNYNHETSEAQSLDQELKRLQVLKSYLILDSEREASFERLTGLASRIFNVPIALVSLVDLGRQWFMSNRGLGDVRETPRKLAFCAHAIISKEDLLIVPNAPDDVRFKDNPLVTGPPNIRFYGGAPLLCPEGYKLGTLCLIDSEPRPNGLSLDEKQNLRELASLVVDVMVQRRRQKLQVLQDKSQIIATTAHDLLTPLSGVQMSLSLLSEDEALLRHLSNNQKELIDTAVGCGDVMTRICNHAIETFRSDVSDFEKENERRKNGAGVASGPKTIIVSEMVKNLNMVMEQFPKKVPLFISVDPLVPPAIVSDDLKLFRSAINFLTNALDKTEQGNVHLKLYVAGKKSKPRLVFECEDTGPGIPLESYPYLFRPFREEDLAQQQCVYLGSGGKLEAGACHSSSMTNSGLGLYSVANLISSIGGEYGFRPRESATGEKGKVTGAIFWFSIPLAVPKAEGGSGATAHHSAVDAGTHNSTADCTSSPSVNNNDDDLIKGKIHVLGTTRMTETEVKDVATEVNSILMEEHHKQSSLSRLDNRGERVRRALVIDDSLVIRKSMSKALERVGFEVTLAVNGLEGLKQLQQQVFDVTLCDYLMPVMDGLDCVQQYRDWEEAHRPWYKQYIVGMSAHASASDVDKGKKAGMNDFKPKPVTMKQIKDMTASEKLHEVSETLYNVLHLRDTEMHPPAEMDEDDEMDHEHTVTISGNPMNNESNKLTALSDEARRSEDAFVCLIAEPSGNTVMKMAAESLGWHGVRVSDGEDALRLLKMRNWDAVFLENEIPRLSGIGCVARFREWEHENRIARQNNIYLLSTEFVPSPMGSVSAVYPSGFDGALGKPILVKDLKAVLRNIEEVRSDSANSRDIVSR